MSRFPGGCRSLTLLPLGITQPEVVLEFVHLVACVIRAESIRGLPGPQCRGLSSSGECKNVVKPAARQTATHSTAQGAYVPMCKNAVKPELDPVNHQSCPLSVASKWNAASDSGSRAALQPSLRTQPGTWRHGPHDAPGILRWMGGGGSAPNLRLCTRSTVERSHSGTGGDLTPPDFTCYCRTSPVSRTNTDQVRVPQLAGRSIW